MQKIGAESRTIPGQVVDADEVLFGLLLRTHLADIPKDRIMINHSNTWNNGSPSIPKPRSRCSHDRYSKSQYAVTIEGQKGLGETDLTCYMLHWPRDTTSYNQFNNRMGVAKEILQPHYHPPNSLTHPSLPLHPLLGMTDPEHLVQLSSFLILISSGHEHRLHVPLSATPLRKKDGIEQKRGERKGREGKGSKNKRNSP